MIKIIVSCAATLDGLIDDHSPERLIISNTSHFELVDKLRAQSDVIMVGANTLRRDNPKLLIKGKQLLDERIAKGLPAQISRATITATGNLPLDLRFFEPNCPSIFLFASSNCYEHSLKKFGHFAKVILFKDGFKNFTNELESLGVKNLMVEGGSNLINQLLRENLIDELHLAISSQILGESGIRLFAEGGSAQNLKLNAVLNLDGMAYLKYINVRS